MFRWKPKEPQLHSSPRNRLFVLITCLVVSKRISCGNPVSVLLSFVEAYIQGLIVYSGQQGSSGSLPSVKLSKLF